MSLWKIFLGTGCELLGGYLILYGSLSVLTGMITLDVAWWYVVLGTIIVIIGLILIAIGRSQRFHHS